MKPSSKLSTAIFLCTIIIFHVSAESASGLPGEVMEICTEAELNNIRKNMDESGAIVGSYRLLCDIDLEDDPAEFAPLGDENHPFSGIFNGDNHSITHFTVSTPDSDNIGFFGRAANAEIENLTLTDVDVHGHERVGALIGWSRSVILRNVHVSGNIEGARFAGGIVGYSQSSTNISNSHTEVNVHAKESVGGLIGWANTNTFVGDSSATGGSISAPSEITPGGAYGCEDGGVYVGGIIGWSGSGTIQDSHSDNSIAGCEIIGGLVGYAQGLEVLRSYATGYILGSSHTLGGLAGWFSNASILNSYATGNVHQSFAPDQVANGMMGGLVGVLSGGTIKNSHATGEAIIFNQYGSAGGLVGFAGVGAGGLGSIITDSFATGEVIGHENGTGGLIGSIDDSRVHNSFATGSVIVIADAHDLDGAGMDYLGSTGGGLLGKCSGTDVTSSYATNSVTGKDRLGGLVGFAGHSSNLIDTFATGIVLGDGNERTGGLVGYLYKSNVNRSYSIAPVQAAGETVGGLVGKMDAPAEVANSYWDIENSGQTESAAGEGRTTADMTSLSMPDGIYASWDFSALGIWSHEIEGQYPVLRQLDLGSCPGDIDSDGMAGFEDMLLLMSTWGACTDECMADIDGDGMVGLSDLTILLAAWGSCGEE